jgi:hypothetical protein
MLWEHEDSLRTQREQRRSLMPVAELRRRAEKDRVVTISKVERSAAEIEDILEQQTKLTKRLDQLRVQQGEQEAKLGRLKHQVAGFAREEAAIPKDKGESAHNKLPQWHSTAAAVKTAAVAKAAAEKAAAHANETAAIAARALESDSKKEQAEAELAQAVSKRAHDGGAHWRRGHSSASCSMNSSAIQLGFVESTGALKSRTTTWLSDPTPTSYPSQ